MKKAVLTLLCFTLLFSRDLKASDFTSEEIRLWQRQANAVNIIRDSYGVAHVYGKSDADAVFGMLYAQCEDGFERVEMNYITALGRVAEVKGEEYIWQDLRARLILDQERAVERYRSAPASLKVLLDAFAAGINYYLYTHPKVKPKLLTRFEPWHHLLFSEGSIGGDIASVSLQDLKEFYADGPAVGWRDDVQPEYGSGSNGFGVAPSRSSSGNAMLYINPHTTFYFRSELHVVSDQGLNAYGAATWGQLFLYQGFNAHCGWMHTSSAADVIDHYAETVSEQNGQYVYRYGLEQRKVETRMHTIMVRTKSGGLDSHEFTGYRTHHGPVVAKKDNQWIAVAMLDEPVKALTQSFLRTKAKDYSDYRRTMDLRTNSSNNTVYADRGGNIAYWHGNFMPKRNPSYNWPGIVPGSDPAADWQGLHEQSEMIHWLNPASGWLQNCNSTPFTATGEPDTDPTRFPAYMAPDSENFRGLHARQVLGQALSPSDGQHKITADQLRVLAFDGRLPGFEQLIPLVVKAWDENKSVLNPILEEPVNLLRNWDFRTSASSVETTLAMVSGRKMIAALSNRPGDNIGMVRAAESQLSALEKLRCLREAMTDLQRDFGTWRVAWGELNRFQRPLGMENLFDDNRASLPAGLGSGFWGALATFESRPFGTRKWYGVSGNSFVAVVEFGKQVKARAILVGGADCDPASPHFTDQASGYLSGTFKDIPFYKADVLRQKVVQYHPGQVLTKKN